MARTSLGANYRRLWAASAASNLGDGVFQLALPLLAVDLTRSPTLVAGVAVAQRLPWLFMTLLAGALADRLDRRRTMVLVNLLRAVLIGGLAVAVATDVANLALVYAVALVLGVGETLFDTAAQSLMPSVVEPGQLSRANGRLYAVELITNQFAGPPLGGFLAALALAAPFGASAGGYLVAAGALALLTGSFRPRRTGEATSLRAEIAEGVRFVWRHPLLRPLALMLGLWNLATTAQWAVFVLYALDPGPMGLSETGVGLLYASAAVGGVAGTWIVERAERRLGRARVLLICVVTAAAATAVPALTADAYVVGASFVVSGVSGVVWNVITVSLRQRITPDHLLGRMNACYRLLGWGGIPIGAALGGVLADAFGLRVTFAVSAALVACLLYGFRFVTPGAVEAAEAEAVARAG